MRSLARNMFFSKLLGTLYKDVKKAKFTVLEKLKGKDMLGWKYEPLFDYYTEEFKDVAYRVVNATYVTDDSGTGIVHQAPAFGEDDYSVALENGIISEQRPAPDPVDESGKFLAKVKDFEGMHVKEADKHIIKYLKGTGRMVVDSQIKHSYPMCPRSDTPLIYRAVPSWFVRITNIVPQMLSNIESSHWTPSFVKERRFASWIANARDWNVSRNRYWGTPIPLWVSDDMEERVCVGSIAELKELSGYEGEITDLHRDKIDHITIPSKQGKGVLRRVEEVFDCWFESGSMPYASQHYPFENVDKFKESFPGHFIAEGLDQTRGWFYTLLVLGTHLFGVIPFRNCVVNGIVLAEDGKKMSKRLKNYPDPTIVLDKYGADALRLYLLGSPSGEGRSLEIQGGGRQVGGEGCTVAMAQCPPIPDHERGALGIIQGEKRFRVQATAVVGSDSGLDQWILAELQGLTDTIRREMGAYRLYAVGPHCLRFIERLTNGYIRLNRLASQGRAWVGEMGCGLQVLAHVLHTFSIIMAPFTPFFAEHVHGKVRPWWGA